MQIHTLQQVYAPKPQSAASLYLHCQGDVAISGETVTLERGGLLSTNTYFNSFYADYWRRFAGLESVGVQIVFTGQVRIAVNVCREHEGEREVASRTADARDRSAAHVTLWLDSDGEMAPDGASPARLFVVVEAMARSEVRSIAYVTDAQPRQDVSLSVGICTFNRETHLEALLTELVTECDRNAAIRQVYVVNQGAGFSSAGLKALCGDQRLKLIEQANLGGCGGFNRTIYEALRTGRTSHHLLMDDDVRVDARLLETVAAFLRYAEHDLVLGGHMLQTDRETLLLEAGAVFDPLWFVSPVGKGADLADASNLAAFDRYRPVDYNGWWFCVLPVGQLESAGYSPPVFIRCDDMEYGCRMSKRGVPTVPLPGVAVWHDLNFSHASDWDQYYDIRNRLILSSIHGDMTAQPGPSFRIWICAGMCADPSVRGCPDVYGRHRRFPFGTRRAVCGRSGGAPRPGRAAGRCHSPGESGCRRGRIAGKGSAGRQTANCAIQRTGLSVAAICSSVSSLRGRRRQAVSLRRPQSHDGREPPVCGDRCPQDHFCQTYAAAPECVAYAVRRGCSCGAFCDGPEACQRRLERACPCAPDQAQVGKPLCP